MPRISALPPTVEVVDRQAILPIVQNSTTYKTTVESLFETPFVVELIPVYGEYSPYEEGDDLIPTPFIENAFNKNWDPIVHLQSPYATYETGIDSDIESGFVFSRQGIYEITLTWIVKIIDYYGDPLDANGNVNIVTKLNSQISPYLAIPYNFDADVRVKSHEVIYNESGYSGDTVSFTDVFLVNFLENENFVYQPSIRVYNSLDVDFYCNVHASGVVKRLGDTAYVKDEF